MTFSDLKKLVIPEGEVNKITVGGVTIWENMKNWVKFSTEADGVTVYNGGLGYKNGYRVRSGGTESKNPDASCTGYIPLKAGDVVRMKGWNANLSSAANSITVFNESKEAIGQVVANFSPGYGIFSSTYTEYAWSSIIENPTGVYAWVAPPHNAIAFMRVTAHTLGNGSQMIITVNQEIS